MSNEWILESVEAFLGSPLWTAPILTFIESTCHEFDDCEENKLVYTTVHNDYSKLVDALIGNFLGDLGVTLQQFEEAYQQIPSSSNRKQGLTDQLLSVNNFVMFKNMMVQSNTRVQREVLALRNSLPQSTATPAEPATVLATQSDDEDVVLRLAIELSKREFLQAEQNAPGGDGGGVAGDEEYRRALQLSVMDEALQREQTEQMLLEQAMQMSLQHNTNVPKRAEDSQRVQMSLQDNTDAPKPVEDSRNVDNTSPSVAPELTEAAAATTTTMTMTTSSAENTDMPTPVPPKVNSSGAYTSCECTKPEVPIAAAKPPAGAATSPADTTTTVPETIATFPANGQRVAIILPELSEACVQDTSATSDSQASEVEGDMSAKIKERAQHLQALRQKLVSKKRAVREAGLQNYTSVPSQTTRPKSAQVAKSATALGSLPPIAGQTTQSGQQFSQSLSAYLQQPDGKQRKR